MKLFYTRKEVDEEISRAIYERERERDRDHRMDCMMHDFMKLEERVSMLEMKAFETKYFPGSGGTGTVQLEFCKSNTEESR